MKKLLFDRIKNLIIVEGIEYPPTLHNPSVRKFLEENKDLTIIGLYWAGYWRLMLCVLGGFFVLGLLSALFE